MENNINKIAVLGTGNAGKTLGSAWAARGYEVTYGSRTPEISLNATDRIVSYQEAIDSSNIIVNTTPGEVVVDLLKRISPVSLSEKVFLDVSVALSDDMNLIHVKESGAEVIQMYFPDLKVVKSLCTMTSTIMVNPEIIGHPTTIFLSGNDVDAKEIVREMLDSLGWSRESQLDLGDLTTARGQEHFSMLYFALAESLGTGDFNIKVYSTK